MSVAELSARERLFTVLDFQEPDRVPVTVRGVVPFDRRWPTQEARVRGLLELGVDEPVRVHVPWLYHPDVSVRTWTEPGERYPVRHKEIRTPAGTLHLSVHLTPDWSPDDVPLTSDQGWVRGVDFPVKSPDDFAALDYVLYEPRRAELTAFREQAAAARKLADELGTWVQGHFWGGSIETMSMLGPKNTLVLVRKDRELVEGTLARMSRWGDRLLEVLLDAGVDVVYRSGCYETVDFYSPTMVRELFMPHLARQTRMCHEAGTRMHHFVETGGAPFLEDYADIPIDILSALDDHGVNPMPHDECRRVLGGRVCLWGGVDPRHAFERGSTEDVQQEVLRVLRVLAPGGGYVLGTTGSLRDDAKEENIHAYIEAGKRYGRYPLSLPA